MNKVNNLKPKKAPRKEDKKIVHANASELYKNYLEIYFNQYMTFSDAKKERCIINMITLFDFLKHIIIFCINTIKALKNLIKSLE